MAALSLKTHTSTVVTPLQSPAEASPLARVSSGIDQLDRLLAGGYPKGRSVLLTGETGSGKTTLALQFLVRAAAAGEKGVLAIVDEKPRHVFENARAFGWELDRLIEKRQLLLLDASPVFTARRRPGRELDVREVASDLARQVAGFKASRLVIDPVTSLAPEDESPGHVREFLRSLIFSLEDNLGCTIVLTAPRAGAACPLSAIAEQLASGVLELGVHRNGSGLRRSILMKKMRGVPVHPFDRTFRIASGEGVVLEEGR